MGGSPLKSPPLNINLHYIWFVFVDVPIFFGSVDKFFVLSSCNSNLNFFFAEKLGCLTKTSLKCRILVFSNRSKFTHGYMQNYLLGILPNLAIFSEAILPWIFACFCKTPLLELSPIQFVISRPRKTRFQIWAFDSKAIRGMQNSNSGRITILFFKKGFFSKKSKIWIFMAVDFFSANLLITIQINLEMAILAYWYKKGWYWPHYLRKNCILYKRSSISLNLNLAD